MRATNGRLLWLVPRGLTRIAARLVVALGALVAVVAITSAYVNGRIQERELVDKVADGASQLSRGIVSAAWHAMRADRREDVYEIMDTIGEREGIERIRLFDARGRVAFSTLSGDTGRVAVTAEPCATCHIGDEPATRADDQRLTRIFEGTDGNRKLSAVTAIYNEPACSGAACHAHPAEHRVLGVLDLTMDLSEVDAELDDFHHRALLVTAVEILIVGTALTILARHFVGIPVRRLLDATRAIGRMDLSTPVVVPDDTELGELGAAVEGMRKRLRAAMDELEDARQDLEEKVLQRTRQLQAAQQKLIQSDRMASLGQLAGMVAHEINNPLGAVLNLSVLMERILTDAGIPAGRETEFREYLEEVSRETARAGRIVQDLLSFSRRSRPHRAPSDLNEVVERTVNLVHHKLALGGVEPQLAPAPDLPLVPCDPSQIEQVVLNLVMNAAESMQGGGVVTVRTYHDAAADTVVLEVTDQGHGIPEARLSRIFEPFFSTKDPGRGVGLGLAVVYGIVQGHHGEIDVLSREDEGTTFRVRLPLHPPENGSATQVSRSGRRTP